MRMSFDIGFGHRQSLVVSQQLRQAIVLLQMGNHDLHDFIEAQAEENPFVELRRPEAPPLPLGAGPRTLAEGPDPIAALPDRHAPSLYVHVARQIARMGLDEAGITLATVFVDAL